MRDNDPFAKFCCDCGRSLTAGLGEAEPTTIGVWSDRARRCANCGETIPPRSRFCSACGTAPAAAARRQSTSNSSRMLLGAFLIVGVALIATFVALLLPGHFG